ncbi:uncharacterized protein Dwil_GK17787 [Drosophila willistoni]|uniref:Glycosyltransferase family 92 protein n=1 Tax=Drosophila willistoni TaxID=7260 RepID=B4N683_DROWI|nr:uncharacterized protein LOC6646050 [Drosophila willistoni]EDW79872.1 uncharacterized protein Dwil_GK17787 [Drosophila willistoni]
MLAPQENRFQYLYFTLSGLVASTILILVYISMRTSLNERMRIDLDGVQRRLIYEKPNPHWAYNNSWRRIGNASLRHEIYSAYFDVRTNVVGKVVLDDEQITIGSLRLFAILPERLRDSQVSCIVRYADFSSHEIVAEEAGAMHDVHNNSFAAWSIMCPVHVSRREPLRLPQAVALSYASNRLSHLSPTFIQISYPRDISQLFAKSRPTISMCVGPLQENYSNVLRLVEFVEMYRLQGATHFYFYYVEASEEVQRVLHHYQRMGLADVFEWNVQNHLQDLHYAGIVAQFNDCVYRANVVDNYRYAAVVDLDEVLMPLKHNTLIEYLRQCDEGRTAGFVFRNVFFYRKDSNDTFNAPPHVINRLLYTQSKVRRTLEVLPAYMRSKVVVNTRAVVEMGNHQVYRTAPGFVDHIVHPTVGLLYHYRDKCINCKMVLIVDYSARRFGSLLFDRVDTTCLEVFMERRGICELA